MTENLKKQLSFYAKIFISVTILYIIFTKINLQGVWENFGKISFLSIIFLFILSAIKVYFQMINWGNYLKLNADYKPLKYEVAKSFFIGEALRFVVPGGLGTLGKVYYVQNQKSATFVSVGVEKFLQIWAALIFAATAGLFYFNQIPLCHKSCVYGVLLILPFLIPFISKLIKHGQAKNYTSQYNKIILPVIGRHTINIMITIIQYYLVIISFVSLSLVKIALAVPLILSANILPVTISGLGLREGFAVEVLAKYGISPEIAVACSLTIFSVSNIIPALIGAFLMLKHKKQKN